MKIGIANDHSSLELKKVLIEFLKENNYEVLNLGSDDNASCDYPLYGLKLAKALQNKEVDLGIGLCGTGIGISLALNKCKGIRACVCSDTYSAKMSRIHNDANCLCLGSRVVGIELAKEILSSFLKHQFEGDRHKRRVDLITQIESGELS